MFSPQLSSRNYTERAWDRSSYEEIDTGSDSEKSDSEFVSSKSYDSLQDATSMPWLHDVPPPGDVSEYERGDIDEIGNQNQKESSGVSTAKPILMKSYESAEQLPVLTPKQAKEVERYFYCTQAAAFPFAYSGGNKNDRILMDNYKEIGDAFRSRVGEESKTVLPENDYISQFVHKSTQDIVSKRCGMDKKDIPGPGEISDQFMTHLSDPKTGLSASIFYDRSDDRREVIIAFSALGSADMGIRQFWQCFLNVCGLVPDNLIQAAEITQIVDKHIKELNESLPEGEKLTLKVVGHSMGGALASYAALKNSVSGLVINPMRLGCGVRWALGKETLENAHKYLTEVVSPGDWVADNPWSVLYKPIEALGFSSTGAIGTAKRRLLPANPACNIAHSDITSCLKNLEAHQKAADDWLPESKKRWFEELSDQARLRFIQGKISDAVFEALTPKPTLKDVKNAAKNRRVAKEKRSNECDFEEPVFKTYQVMLHAKRIAILQQKIYDIIFEANFSRKCQHDSWGRYVEPEVRGINNVSKKDDFKELCEQLKSELTEYEAALRDLKSSDSEQRCANAKAMRADIECYSESRSLVSAILNADLEKLIARMLTVRLGDVKEKN